MSGPRARSVGLAARARGLARDGVGLLVPVDCVGCGAWDVAVCELCRTLITTTPVRCEADSPLLTLPGDAGPLLPAWSLADYAGPVRGVVLGWKRTARPDVARVVLGRAGEAARRWAHDPDLHLDGEGPVLVVPAPSGRGRRLRRQLVAADLADAVAHGLAAAGVLAPGRRLLSVDLLRRAGSGGQRGGGVRARSRNRQAPVRVLAPVGPEDVVVLVDDVLTTGATLAACARGLVARGARVAGALVVAAAPPPGRRS